MSESNALTIFAYTSPLGRMSEKQPIPSETSSVRSKNSEDFEPPTDWRSIYVAAGLGFSCSVQFSLYFTSLWPYLDVIDKKATETFFGFIIASYSFGQIVASPSFGYWSNRIKSIKTPMYAGIVCMFIGNLIYLSTELLPSGRRYAMLVARLITGLGSANVTLVKTYASTSCNPRDRAKALAYVTGGIAFGMTIGPAIQLVFTPIGYPGLVLFKGLSLNMYTASAYAACAMNFVSAIGMATMFKETYVGIVKEQKKDEESECSIDLNPVPKFDWFAVLLCNFTRFTQQFISTNLETIGSPLGMQVFAFTKEQTVRTGSIAQGGMGFLSLCTYIVYIAGDLNRFIDYRVGNICSLLLFLAFHLITYPWPFLPQGLTSYKNGDLFNATHEVVGCNVDKFSWCTTTKQVNIWLYYIAFAVIMGASFSAMNITLNTIYGRILGPRRQGTMQGVLQVSGGLARMVGPVTISALYSAYGPSISWISEIVVISINLVLWAIMFKRMVPLKLIHERESGVPIKTKSGYVYRI
uniref:MFS domain-containing protein n=1 Tax=Steinernema glaseri TaxID=37863 RepID=A0A1I7ZCB8_9BILA